MRILFTGGGSGGHIYPLVAVTQRIKKIAEQKRLSVDFYYLGVPENYTAVLEKNGFTVSKIVSAKWRRYFDVRNFIDIPKFFIALLQSFWKVFWLMPDVLFSKGGTGALPVVLACRFYRVPVIIHESDTIPGMNNLLSVKFAQRIAISFSLTRDFLLRRTEIEKQKNLLVAKIALTGNPIRQFFFERTSDMDQEIAKKTFGFTEVKRPLILVMGASQGAASINDLFLEIAEELIFGGYNVLHQTGIKNFEEFKKGLDFVLKKHSPELKLSYQAVPYFDENIKDAYLAADIVVSRSGSSSIFEVAAMGKPAILIPLSGTASNSHQLKNAIEYAQFGACIFIEQENLKPHVFMDQLKKLIGDPERIKAMSAAAVGFSKPQAADVLAQEILRLGGHLDA